MVVRGGRGGVTLTGYDFEVFRRSPALTTYLSSLRQTVLPRLRRAFPLALVIGIAAALVAAGGAAVVAAAQPKRYTASAVFYVLARPPEIKAVSTNRALVAEQVAQALRSGRADEIAATAAAGRTISGEWVNGPGFAEISYRVESADADAATDAARAVFDQAGYLGVNLIKTKQPRPVLDLREATEAARVSKPAKTTVPIGAAVGGFSGLAISLLIAVPAGRREEPSGGEPAEELDE